MSSIFSRAILVFSFCALYNISNAQEIVDLLTEKPLVECSTISFNAATLFEESYIANDFDKAALILKEWENKCGLREPIFRAKILLSIATKTYNDSLMLAGSLNHLQNFEYRKSNIDKGRFYTYDNYAAYYGYIPFGQNFDKLTTQIAATLKESQAKNSTAYYICDFYSGNVTPEQYKNMLSTLDPQSGYSNDYNTYLSYYEHETKMNIAGFAGVWHPTCDLAFIGTKPEIGLVFGGKYQKWNVDLNLGVKFGGSKNDYIFRRTKDRGQPLDTSNYFVGYMFGVEVGYDLYSGKRNEWSVIAGAAVDGFSTEVSDEDRNTNEHNVTSYNFNAGIGYRYYFKNDLYIGFKAKVHAIDYRLNNVVEFNGVPFTFHVLFGGLSSVFKRDLKSIGYTGR